MKKTYQDRQAFLDRLEKKYIKKVQLHAFKRESEILKQQLSAMRGRRASQVDDIESDLFDTVDYKLTYS